MSNEDHSLDLTGFGKLAKAIPPSAWNKLVNTACETFAQLISPFVATTSGTGRLIQAKFERMVEVQKVLAADAVLKAKQKVDRAGRPPKGKPKAQVIVVAMENASNESDDTLREIWSNLIANELLDNRVHPDFPKILERLSSNDAVTLAEIAESNKKDSIKVVVRAFVFHLSIAGVSFSPLVEEESDFAREHLSHLNLVRKSGGGWRLTLTGEEFLKAVVDPSYGYTSDPVGTSNGMA